ncbi:MAG: hypothetical protein H7273_01965 [Polaromonas sp.]|nr:hypothetical protein [Polaromonas sp.]
MTLLQIVQNNLTLPVRSTNTDANAPATAPSCIKSKIRGMSKKVAVDKETGRRCAGNIAFFMASQRGMSAAQIITGVCHCSGKAWFFRRVKGLPAKWLSAASALPLSFQARGL